jgi:hypothetical protein
MDVFHVGGRAYPFAGDGRGAAEGLGEMSIFRGGCEMVMRRGVFVGLLVCLLLGALRAVVIRNQSVDVHLVPVRYLKHDASDERYRPTVSRKTLERRIVRIRESSSIPLEDHSIACEQAVVKGRHRQALIDARPTGEDATQFTHYSHLSDHGWCSDQSPMSARLWGIEGRTFQSIAKDLGITPQNSFKAYSQHAATAGRYENIISVDPGVVFAWDSLSPETSLARQRTAGGRAAVGLSPPRLRHWSDVAFLDWKHASATAGRDGTDLGLIVRCKIINDAASEVGNIVAARLGIVQEEIPDKLAYPGVVIAKGTDEFLALMGTPNGGGTARFLADHQWSLGWKEVVAIRLVFDPKPGMGMKRTAWWFLMEIGEHR